MFFNKGEKIPPEMLKLRYGEGDEFILAEAGVDIDVSTDWSDFSIVVRPISNMTGGDCVIKVDMVGLVNVAIRAVPKLKVVGVPMT